MGAWLALDWHQRPGLISPTLSRKNSRHLDFAGLNDDGG